MDLAGRGPPERPCDRPVVIRGDALALLPVAPHEVRHLSRGLRRRSSVRCGGVRARRRRSPRRWRCRSARGSRSSTCFTAPFNPEAPYGDYPRLFVLAKHPARAARPDVRSEVRAAVLRPIYLVSAVGGVADAARAEWRWLGAVLLAAIAVHVGSTTRLYMWWGGTSAPARFLVPILPCLAAPIAIARRSSAVAGRARAAVDDADRERGRSPSAACWIPSGCCSSATRAARAASSSRYRAPHRWLRSCPTFAQEDWLTPLVSLLPWLAAAGSRRPLSSRFSGAGAPWLAARRGTSARLVFMAAASVTGRSRSRKRTAGARDAREQSMSCGSTTRSAFERSITPRFPHRSESGVRLSRSRSTWTVVRRVRLNV